MSAETASIGAVAPELKSSLHIGNAELGLLASITTIAGDAATLPVGVLVDRVPRTRLLAVAALTWAGATAASALAWSFPALLVIRVLLGVLTAAAGPGVASLQGDSFSAQRRARIYGLVLAGELVGTGVRIRGIRGPGGYLVAGSVRGARGAGPGARLVAMALARAGTGDGDDASAGSAAGGDPAALPLWTVVRYVESRRI